jgi:DNA ligase (NAD+)
MITNIKEYLEKLNFLKKNDKFYYEDSDPKISDAEYDILKNELIAFEKLNKKFNFVSNKVGFIP